MLKDWGYLRPEKHRGCLFRWYSSHRLLRAVILGEICLQDKVRRIEEDDCFLALYGSSLEMVVSIWRTR